MTRTMELDAVIIGSGAGGGTVAERLAPLAEAGARIAVLEEGHHFPLAYFTQREVEMMGLFRYGGGWPIKDGSITLAAGRGLGGSTLVYTGVTFRLPDAVCEKWGVPGLTPKDLAPRFERLEKDLSVIVPGDDMVNDNNRLFAEACETLGWEVKKIPLNLSGCEQEGFCNLGCATGAKQGAMAVQLPRAQKAGVVLVPNCRVEKIGRGKVSAKVSEPPPGTVPGPWEPGEVEISAKRIVCAAGSPATPGLLLAAGLEKELPALGRYFTLHPAMTLYGVMPHPIKNYQGFPKTYYTPRFSQTHHFYLETAFYYPFVSTKHLGLWGEDLARIMTRYANFMTVIALNHDPASEKNRIRLSRKGEVIMDYTIAKESVESLAHAQVAATRLFIAAGCREMVMPMAKKPVFTPADAGDKSLEEFISPKRFLPIKTPLSSAHPQGGCRMGAGPEDSVTDPWGKVHGREDLYVADASLFPQSSAVNPYLTVMALADRVGQKLVESADSWG
ncbi:MAG: GMC family oxidoreductase [Deltaproteobacteria bacterium]|nr:GMC family oxidoreductase [Deltaproteobacteria bacterium]